MPVVMPEDISQNNVVLHIPQKRVAGPLIAFDRRLPPTRGFDQGTETGSMLIDPVLYGVVLDRKTLTLDRTCWRGISRSASPHMSPRMIWRIARSVSHMCGILAIQRLS